MRCNAYPCGCIADSASYGKGWPGKTGVPAFTATPFKLGLASTIKIGDSTGAGTTGFVLVGLKQASTVTSFGGVLLVQPIIAVLPVPVPIKFQLPIPKDQGLCGLCLALQVIEVDKAASNGISFSQGILMIWGV